MLMKMNRCHSDKIVFGLFFVFCVASLVCALLLSAPLTAQSGTYLDSAHGNSSYGVKRVGYGFPDYTKGLCAHCHEQHASIDGAEPDPAGGGPDKYMLLAENFSGAVQQPYSQSHDVCFSCHYGVGTLQSTAFYNESYSSTFGGEAAASSNIFDTFNKASYHNLKDVLTVASNNWSGTFSAANSNPCSVCHNSHLARRINANQGNPGFTAISKPSSHSTLWGSVSTERMNYYTAYYRAPFSVGANPASDPTKHEPDGVSRSYTSNEVQGSNLPDYVTFCNDCHNSIVSSYTLGRNLYAIDWTASGDQHGKGDGAGSAMGDLKAPYTSDGTSGGTQVDSTNFVTSCTDCHEPHGSSNEYLIRTTVNGSAVSITTSGKWYSLCITCHSLTGDHTWHTIGNSCNGSGCHDHGSNF